MGLRQGTSENPFTVIASEANQSITCCFIFSSLDRQVTSLLAMTVSSGARQ